MVKKWIAITIEDRKMKNHLICYSEMKGKYALHNDISAMQQAIKWLEKENCRRIIIEKEELRI